MTDHLGQGGDRLRSVAAELADPHTSRKRRAELVARLPSLIATLERDAYAQGRLDAREEAYDEARDA